MVKTYVSTILIIYYIQYEFYLVHICIERHCQNALDDCLQWIKDHVRNHHMFIQSDRYGNTLLHAGIYRTNFGYKISVRFDSIFINHFLEKKTLLLKLRFISY